MSLLDTGRVWSHLPFFNNENKFTTSTISPFDFVLGPINLIVNIYINHKKKIVFVEMHRIEVCNGSWWYFVSGWFCTCKESMCMFYHNFPKALLSKGRIYKVSLCLFCQRGESNKQKPTNLDVDTHWKGDFFVDIKRVGKLRR